MKLFSFLGIPLEDKVESRIAYITLSKTEDDKHVSDTEAQRCAFSEKKDKEIENNVLDVQEEQKWFKF